MSKDLIARLESGSTWVNPASGLIEPQNKTKTMREAARVIREQEAEIAKLNKALSVALEALEDKIDAAEPSEIDDIIGNAIDHCGYFMEGPVKQKVMLAARCVRVALTNAGLLASSPAPAVEPSRNAVSAAEVIRWKTATSQTADMLRAAYAIDRISPASDGWEPIESAPSAKAVLIAYTNRSDKWRIVRAVRYERLQSEQEFDEFSTTEYCEEQDSYFIPAGWYELIDNWDDFSSVSINEGKPLFWCDLPPLPTKAED